MRNILLMLCLSLLFSQCTKEKYKRGFEMSYTQFFEIIPGTITPFQKTYYTTPPIVTDYAAKFAENNISVADVETIVSKFIRFTITFPSSENFDFASRVFVYVNDGQNDFEIGFLEPVPENQSTVLNLIPNVTEMKEYLTSETFTLKFAFSPRTIPFQYIDIRADLTFQVVPFED